MSDMELVIKIPEEMYKWVNDVNKFFDDYGISDFIDLVKNGIPLPKGHGRLIDADKIRIVRTPDSAVDENTEIIICAIKQYINQLPTIVESEG